MTGPVDRATASAEGILKYRIYWQTLNAQHSTDFSDAAVLTSTGKMTQLPVVSRVTRKWQLTASTHWHRITKQHRGRYPHRLKTGRGLSFSNVSKLSPLSLLPMKYLILEKEVVADVNATLQCHIKVQISSIAIFGSLGCRGQSLMSLKCLKDHGAETSL